MTKKNTKREKVLNAINRISQDFLPTQIDYTPEMKEKIKKLLDIEDIDVDKRLGNNIKYFPLNDIIKIDRKNGIKYDIWGVGWDQILAEGFHIRYFPLIDSDNYRKYKFPNYSDGLLSIIKEEGPKYKEGYFLLSLQDFTLFERLWCLIGYENTLSGFYFREREINYLLDGITDFNVEISKKIITLEVIDGLYTGDDFGTQRGMVMSPEMWRKFFKERYKKIWGIYKDKNLPIFHHSCGNILEIVPDLIEIGLDVLTPIQPEAMNPIELSNRFGKNLSFMGGISTQSTLPFKNPKDVRNEVVDRIKVLGRYDGYIISPSHEITSDCKDENFVALIETLEEYRRGKLEALIK